MPEPLIVLPSGLPPDTSVSDLAAAVGDSNARHAADRELAAMDRAAAALDRRAAALRDAAATARDEAADARDLAAVSADAHHHPAGQRAFAAEDRAASALDRRESAADRHGAADHLQQSYRDELTGMLLRDAGRDQLRRAVSEAHRRGELLAIAFLDVDNLKQVNDEQGHASGDLLLREVGIALQTRLRSHDVMVRYGGDEFVCAMPGSKVVDAGRRLDEVAELLGVAIIGATFSIGLVQLRDGESLEEAIGRADREMYDSRRRPAELRRPG
jgi:diguanylate cyclase (GGDEF)-like protein